MDEIDYWVKHFNARGHASRGHTTHATEDRVTLSILEDWQAAVRVSDGLEISLLELNKNDPPDATGQVNGNEVKIELTELVDGDLLRVLNQSSNASGHRETSAHGNFFFRAQWNKERFLSELGKRLIQKQNNYQKRGIAIDFLVVFTAEDWLNPYDVSEWLEGWEAPSVPNLLNIHLIFDYRPNWKGGYPVFLIKSAA